MPPRYAIKPRALHMKKKKSSRRDSRGWIKKNNKNILLAAYFGIKPFVQRAPIDSHKTIVVALRFF